MSADVLPLSIPLVSLKVSSIPRLIVVANTITAERLAFTAVFQEVLEDEGKSLGLSLSSSDTQSTLVPSYIFTVTIALKTTEMAADDESVTYANA